MSTRKSLAWSFGEGFGQHFLRFVGAMIIARLLTPDEVGVFALAVAASVLIVSLGDYGFGAYLIREERLTDDKIRTAFGIGIILSWTFGLAILAIRHPFAALYGEPGIAQVSALVAASFFITPFGQPAQSLLSREMRFNVLHHIGVTSVLAGTITSVVLAALGFSYMALAWGMFVGTVLRSLLALAARPDHLKLWPSFRHWRDVAKFGGWPTAASVAGCVTMEASKFVLGGLLSPAAVALFARANQIPKTARQGLFAPAGRVLFPSFAKKLRAGEPIGPSVETFVGATTLILWPAFLTTGVLAQPVIVLLFGPNWAVAGEILPYVLAAAALLVSLPAPEQILTPYGKVKTLFWVRVFNMATTLSLAAIGAAHSLELFAMLRVVDAALFIGAVYIFTRNLLQVSLSSLLQCYGKALFVSLLCAMPAAALYGYDGNNVHPALVVGAMMMAPVIWMICIFAMQHPFAKEIRFVIARLWRLGARAHGEIPRS